jgi:WD40 repeat protein
VPFTNHVIVNNIASADPYHSPCPAAVDPTTGKECTQEPLRVESPSVDGSAIKTFFSGAAGDTYSILTVTQPSAFVVLNEMWETIYTQALPTDNGVYGVAVSPDCSTFTIGTGKGILRCYRHDHDVNEQVWETVAHTGTIYDLDYTAHGSCIVSAGGDRGTCKIWAAETGYLLQTFNQTSFVGVWSVFCSPMEGNVFFAGLRNGNIIKWYIDSGRSEELTGHSGAVTKMAMSQDGDKLFSLGNGDLQTKCWDHNSGKCLWTHKYEGATYVSSVAVAGDHVIVGAMGAPTIGLSMETGEVMQKYSSFGVQVFGLFAFPAEHKHLSRVQSMKFAD